MDKSIKAWYFARPDNRLDYDDCRLVRVGITHTVEGKPELCKHGLHGSERIIDALRYANYHRVYRVVLGGEMDIGDDKIAAQSRQYIQRFDIENVLFEFARKQALINIENIKPYISESDYQLIIDWLNTGNKSIKSAAGSASKSAVWSASGSAAWSAKSAVWSVSESAAWSASGAAETAAWSAGWSAKSAAWSAESAAWSIANDMLLSMIENKYGEIK